MNGRQTRHPFSQDMYREGARIVPSPPTVPRGVPSELAPWRSASPGMAPGMTPQITPEAWLFRPEVAADRLIRVPNLQEIDAGLVGNSVGIQWPDDGYVLACSAVARADGTNAGQASLALQIQAGDQGTYITGNGQSSDYVLFWNVSPSPGATALIYRAVARQETWTVTCRNYHSATAYTPEVTFFFKTLRGC